MKFKRLTDVAKLPVKHDDHLGITLFSSEHVRIQPNETKIIHTGIVVEELEGNVLLLSLERSMGHLRPFIMPTGVEVISQSHEGNEITILLFNRSLTIPAVVDEGEAIVYGLKLNMSQLSSVKPTTIKKTKDKME